MNVDKKRRFLPPKIWEGETVYVIGGGPSLKQSPLHLIHDRRVLGVNDAFKLGTWVDACYFGDCKWWGWNREEFLKYPGLRMTSCQRLYHLYVVKIWKRGKPKGVETKPGFISWNGNSGMSAINVAYHFGAKKIVLLGFDMQGKKDHKGVVTFNWHNYHKSPPVPHAYKSRYLPCMHTIVEDLKALKVEIVNASEETAIDPLIVPRVRLEDTL